MHKIFFAILLLTSCTPEKETESINVNDGSSNNGSSNNGSSNNGSSNNSPNNDNIDTSCATALCSTTVNWECPSISDCDSVLSADSAIETSEFSDETSKQKHYLSQQLCDESRSTEIYNWLKQEGQSGSLGVSYAGFGLSGGASSQELSSEDNFRQWQRNRCEEAVQNASAESVSTFMKNFRDTTSGVSAWETCVRLTMEAYSQCAINRGEFSESESLAIQGLTIHIPPENVPVGNIFSVTLRWCGLPGSSDKQTAKIKTFSHNGADCDFNEGDTVCGGETVISCTRLSPERIELNLNIESMSIDSGNKQSIAKSIFIKPLCGWTQQTCCNGTCSFPNDQCVDDVCQTTREGRTFGIWDQSSWDNTTWGE